MKTTELTPRTEAMMHMFEPTVREKVGPMHIDKTRQDRMPVSQRPRVQEAQRRLAKMRKGAKSA